MLLALGIVGVCNTFTSLLRLIALCCRNMPLTYYSPKRDFFFLTYTWSMQDSTHALSAVHLQQSDLHPNDSLRTIPVSPCMALFSDSKEHHHQAHFSSNSADNACEPPQSYLSSLSALHKEFFSRAM